jgi:predicted glycoside hydrolase/deacetylase ChbG (UPF0249 family)
VDGPNKEAEKQQPEPTGCAIHLKLACLIYTYKHTLTHAYAHNHTHTYTQLAPAVEDPNKEAAEQQPVPKAAPAHSITQEEFNSVSNVVRGRCKLEECNALLQQVVYACVHVYMQHRDTRHAVCRCSS